jgi:hypothetical protein
MSDSAVADYNSSSMGISIGPQIGFGHSLDPKPAIDDIVDPKPSITPPEHEYGLADPFDKSYQPDPELLLAYEFFRNDLFDSPTKPVDQAIDYLTANLISEYELLDPYDLSHRYPLIDYSGMGRILEQVSKLTGKFDQKIAYWINVGGQTKVQEFKADRRLVDLHERKHNDPVTPHEKIAKKEEDRANTL